MNTKQEIIYLSGKENVSMGDAWFEFATIDHFWIRRRYEVLKIIYPQVKDQTILIGEIGCGSGVVQRQIEIDCKKQVDGFDLNEFALKNNIAEDSQVYCYNIHDRNQTLKEKYDVLILFDVIEHIEDVEGFIDSTLFHLKKGGKLIINVPSLRYLMSKYDIAAGHVKRYLPSDFYEIESKHKLKTVTWTFWGFWFIPLLLLRKIILLGSKDKNLILKSGFSKKNKFVNMLLKFISKLEITPQHITGTSLMWIFKKD